MLDYETRKAQATGIYERGLKRVRETDDPEGQTFKKGQRVNIAWHMPRWANTRYAGKAATVEYSYAHAYGGTNVTSYSLNVDGCGSVAWFHEEHLSLAVK